MMNLRTLLTAIITVIGLGWTTVSYGQSNNTITITTEDNVVTLDIDSITNAIADYDFNSLLKDMGLDTRINIDKNGLVVVTKNEDGTVSQQSFTMDVDSESVAGEETITIKTVTIDNNGKQTNTTTITSSSSNETNATINEENKSNQPKMKYWVDEDGNRHEVEDGDKIIIIEKE